MAQSIENGLLEAVKKDDIKAFNALMEKARCGAYRLGRFPVLSLLYLYKSRKILSAYEEKFIKITAFQPLREPAEISKKFSGKAGKCLRLYLNEIVSPLEMLLILDKTRRLKRVYPLTKPSAAVKERLKQIYSIKYSLNVKFEDDNIIIDRRPLSYREKKHIATAVLCSFLAVTVAVGVPVTTVKLMPKPVDGEVKKLSEIDFNSKKQYILKKDIIVPENYTVEKVNCKIVGNGNKLILNKGATLGEFNGSMSDLTIRTSGDPIFTVVSESATVSNLKINVNAEISSEKNTAFLALTNYGTIDGVTVNVSGTLTALAGANDATCGGLVVSNSARYNSEGKVVIGNITNCTVNYSDFSLKGEASANSAFGGVAGVNNGILSDCTVTGEISADTFDVAGICVSNVYMLSDCVSEANLSHTSFSTEWDPVACGIVIENGNALRGCENRGNISVVSYSGHTTKIPTVSAAGIAYINSSAIVSCKNSGNIYAVGNGNAFVGGISSQSYTAISNCYSSGGISVTANKIYAGGILGFSAIYNYGIAGSVEYCISESKINASPKAEVPAYVGGIVGLLQQGYAESIDTYYCGSITNCYFIGECDARINYFGNIVGVCGAKNYEINSYTITKSELINMEIVTTEYTITIFEDNYYAANSFSAFGAVASSDEEGKDVYTSVVDKGVLVSTKEEIENLEAYREILQKLTE
ncbi:MAG: hypothetical protein K2N23_04635 [Clostridia bacterium]|nr:hypothetical protein [Clostridia bacterium]